MCCECGCGPRHRYHEGHHRPFMGFPPLMSVEGEVKLLEELKETLEDRLNKVNERLETLKR
ncbi:MAG: hypothetical protein ACLFU9_02025 [Candidatus Bathyarchaeia archaeon]